MRKVYPDRLGAFIATEREKKFPSRIAFAKKYGLDPSTIGDIENGDTKSPGLSSILTIAEGLGISPMRLISVYQGKDPDEIEDDQRYKAPLIEFLHHLPEELILEALKARPPQDVLKGLIESKGIEKIQECLAEAKRRQQEKS